MATQLKHWIMKPMLSRGLEFVELVNVYLYRDVPCTVSGMVFSYRDSITSCLRNFDIKSFTKLFLTFSLDFTPSFSEANFHAETVTYRRSPVQLSNK